MVAGASSLALALRIESYGRRQIARAKWLAKSWSSGNKKEFYGLCVAGSGTAASFTGYTVGLYNGDLYLASHSTQGLATGPGAPNVITTVPADGTVGSVFEVGDILELRVERVGALDSLEVWNYSDDPDRNGRIMGPELVTAVTSSGVPGIWAAGTAVGAGSSTDWEDFDGIDEWAEYIDSGFEDVVARVSALDIIVQPKSAHMHITAFRRAPYNKISDDFNRANNNSLGDDWTESEDTTSNISINSSALRLNTSSSSSIGIAYHNDPIGDDQLIRARWSSKSWAAGANVTARFGVFVRGSGTASDFTGYAAYVSNGVLVLAKFAAEGIQSGTSLTTVVADAATGSKFKPGDMLELRVHNNLDGVAELEVWVISEDPGRNGRVLGPTTSSSPIVGGAVGFLCGGVLIGGNGSTVWEDMEARDF
jgi:hypothetical protein